MGDRVGQEQLGGLGAHHFSPHAELTVAQGDRLITLC
jgi:hypothetical protein